MPQEEEEEAVSQVEEESFLIRVRNHGSKRVISVYKYAVFFFSFSSRRECTSVSKSKPTLYFAVI